MPSHRAMCSRLSRSTSTAAHEAGLREVRLIHGRGKGVQRGLVRQALERHPLVVETSMSRGAKAWRFERAFDRDLAAVTLGRRNVAVTIVLMPPRTEKSPTTVMRRGWHAATRSSRIWLVTAS